MFLEDSEYKLSFRNDILFYNFYFGKQILCQESPGVHVIIGGSNAILGQATIPYVLPLSSIHP